MLLCVSLEGEPGPCPRAELLFLGCSSLVSASPPFPDEQLFKYALWNSGKVIEAGGCSLQTRNGGHRKASVPRSPTGPCSVSLPPLCLSLPLPLSLSYSFSLPISLSFPLSLCVCVCVFNLPLYHNSLDFIFRRLFLGFLLGK